jgi:hypothetical protein
MNKQQTGAGLLNIFSKKQKKDKKKDIKETKVEISKLEKVILNLRNEKLRDQIIILKINKENEKLKVQVKNLETEKGKNLKKNNKCSTQLKHIKLLTKKMPGLSDDDIKTINKLLNQIKKKIKQ